MLIQDFVVVRAPYAVVRDRLTQPMLRWLIDGANAAYAEGDRLSMMVSPADGEVRELRRVHLELGPAYARGEGVVVPLSWWAIDARRVLPTLDADLEVMPMGPDQVMLTLMGSYEPPIGQVGLDRLVLHRIAETCIRSFLRRAAEHLEHQAAA